MHLRQDTAGSTRPLADHASVWAVLAESSVEGLLVVSPHGDLLVMNRRFAEVWGFHPGDLAEATAAAAAEAAAQRVADPALFSERIAQIYAAGEASHDEIELRDGRVLDRYGIPLHDDGVYLGWAWHFRDMTAQKTAEADLRRLAETLQASLLPPRPPTIPGLEVATRYRPAQAELGVGGDFYDVFRLRTNDWGLVLGDVCSKGVHAARLTGLARYTETTPLYPAGEPHWGPHWRPKPPREARLTLQGDPTSAAVARHFVTGVLHSWRLSLVADGDVELLTSELVGNAIRYGEAPFSVIVEYAGDTVRVAVGDGAPALPRRLQADPGATGGRGIQIVHDVAARWGVTRTADGKRVWFELPVPEE